MSANNALAVQCGSWLKPVLGRKSRIAHASFLAKRGDRYLVWGTGFGAFRNHINEIAEWNGQEWLFLKPKIGSMVLVEDEDTIYTYGNGKEPWTIYGTRASMFPMLTANNHTTTINSANAITTTGNIVTTSPSNTFIVDVPPRPQLAVGDLVWHKVSKRGPYVLISKKETDFFCEVPSNSGRRDDVSLTSMRVNDTWVVLDKRGRFSSIPGAALTQEKPTKLVNTVGKYIAAALMVIFFPATLAIWAMVRS